MIVSPPRNAAALLEVLMAMIVMGIGVLTVATLFPISVLRAVQATKLTNATIVRFNAEAQMNMEPRMYVDPDDDDDPLDFIGVSEHTGTNYLVDPLGYFMHEQLGDGYENDFALLGVLPRFKFTAKDTPADADALVDELTVLNLIGDNDSWNSQVEGVATVTPPSTVTMDAGIDLTGVNYTTLFSRVLILDDTGRNSIDRRITGINIATNEITVIPDIPAAFIPMTARVETLESKNFTWMLTVRNNALNDIQVDVVVFYRRSTNVQDETPYPLTRGGTLSEYSVGYAAGAPKPWKRGAWMIDPDGARWYQIQRVVEGNGRDVLTLDRPAPGLITRGVFPRGIVEVYPLGNKAPQE